jgi:ADP-ribose pyrophosphatase YjhB (NUDIX family)
MGSPIFGRACLLRANRIMLDYIKTLRGMIGNSRIVLPGVRALIFSDQRELLLEKQTLFGSWALPHGCVDVGESALDALKREVKEETGLTVAHAEPFGLYSDPKYSVTYPNGDQVQTFTMAFLVRAWFGELAADGDEVAELGFFPLDNLPDPIYPIHVDTILDYLNSNGAFVMK